MDKIQLEIIALSQNVAQSHSYAILLGEIGGDRRLPIVIGGFEAQAIAVALEKMTPSRPLTHDLIKNIIDAFNIELKEVVIHNLNEGVFYSKLVCEQNGVQVEIDTRTSDAIAIAVRVNCPIFTHSNILDSAGVIMSGDAAASSTKADSTPSKSDKKIVKKEDKEKTDYSNISTEALETQLNELLEQEEYEKAAKIRDEIAKRKGN